MIRRCSSSDFETVYEIINESASAYEGVIPEDRWHVPYMPREELQSEIRDGVMFWCLEEDGHVLGVMGIQDKGDVALIRHSYVRSTGQKRGVGTTLLRHLEEITAQPILIGTWADASWAIAFYRKNGFSLLPEEEKNRLLRKYWAIPERQVETSVVLADRKWMDRG